MKDDCKMHSVRLLPYYDKMVTKIKKLLSERRMQGRPVSTCKVVEFLLEVFQKLEKPINKVYFPEPDDLTNELLGKFNDVPVVEKIQASLSEKE